MATWSIEHIPASGGASTFASLAVWGFASLQMSFVNWGIDQAAITTRGGSIAFEAAQFAYKDKLVVWRNGARFAHFWVTGLGASAQKQESRTYILSGPSWWLAQLPFHWPLWPVKETLEESEKRAGMWIQYALDSAIGMGAPLAHESGTAGYPQFSAPASDISASRTCLEVVQRSVRVHPMSSGTWDMSGETPALVCRTRANLAAQSIAVSDSIETFGFTPNLENQALSVQIEYVYGDDATIGASDAAGAAPGEFGPNHLHITVPVADATAAWNAGFLGVAAKLYEGLGPLAWTGALNFHATEELDVPLVRPGVCVNLTGGLAEWSTMNACAQAVVWALSPETNDLCTVTFGAPEQLGVQDFLEFASAGYISGGSAGGNPGPYDPPTPPSNDPGTPGTIDDLNGTTGGGAPLGGIAVQSRGGAWTLGGYSSYDGSAPTRRWLRADTAYTRTYDCGGGAGQQTDQWSAYGVYDPANFAAGPTVTGGVLLHGWDGGQYFCSRPETYAKSASTATATATPGSYTSIGSCCGSDSTYTLVSGSETNTLSSEYTEDDAWSRLLSTAEWGDGATTAIRTVPTTAATGIRREMRYRTEHTETVGQQIWIEGQWVSGAWVPGHYRTATTATTYPTLCGLTPWQRYRVTIPLESRPVDESGAATGAYAADGTRTHYCVANLDGEGGFDWQHIEPRAGYETRIGTPLVEAA